MSSEIERSKKTLEAIIISSTTATAVLMVVAILLLAQLRDVTGLSMPVLRNLILIALPLAWITSNLTAYLNWNKIKYYYDENRLSISRLRPFSGTETTSYGYETMGNVRLIQTRFGKKHNFGDVVIQQKDQPPIILRVIDDPFSHAKAIERNIAEKKIYIATTDSSSQ